MHTKRKTIKLGKSLDVKEIEKCIERGMKECLTESYGLKPKSLIS